MRAREPETGTAKEVGRVRDQAQSKKALAFPEGIVLGLGKKAGKVGEKGGRERGVESRSEIEVKVLEGGGETSGDK